MIVVTGASGGIGSSILESLSTVDDVIGIYNENKPTSNNDKIHFSKVDLLSEKSITKFCIKHDKLLKDITVVHCAAISVDNFLLDISTSEWDKVLGVNVRSNFLLSKALIPNMIENKWGRIIHISSIVGSNGVVGTSSYAASKTALHGLSSVMSKEYARFGITSNILSLGYFEEGLINSIPDTRQREIISKIPSRKFGKIEEILFAIKWLIESEYTNGANIKIDGGM